MVTMLLEVLLQIRVFNIKELKDGLPIAWSAKVHSVAMQQTAEWTREEPRFP